MTMITNNRPVATMPTLEYALDSLAPNLSFEAMDYHYNKHLKAYVDNTNRLAEGTRFAGMKLEEVVLEAEGPLFNNAAQVWNHTFFFDSLAPNPKRVPTGQLMSLIEKYFGSLLQLHTEFNKSAMSLFGSGWMWLVQDAHNRLLLLSTHNAACPLSHEVNPLLTIDLWEHAYYIDYRNRRADAVAATWGAIDWKKVEERYRKQ